MRGGDTDQWLDSLSGAEFTGAMRRVREIVASNAADARWGKSSHATFETRGNTVEVLRVGGARGVRDTRDPDGARLVFTERAWQEFVAGVKAGEFD